MKINADQVFFGIEIPLDRFSDLAAAHLARVKHTADIEALGGLLIKRRFPKTDAVELSAASARGAATRASLAEY